MKFSEYQENAARTANPVEYKVHSILISTLGLSGEAGEVADYLKKVYGHGHDLDEERLKKELGDVLWYIADLCTKFDFSMDEVAQLNVEKLKKRYPEGFSEERSQNRDSTDT